MVDLKLYWDSSLLGKDYTQPTFSLPTPISLDLYLSLSIREREGDVHTQREEGKFASVYL